ncbi:hypothetical protein [Pseudobdellovibrio sp. HCB154]|uniref:hypothetical protein n=1 Tax=Pseudobdellovibrio sp. HCB154 TaxID=3386277 RepID=UPI003916F20B
MKKSIIALAAGLLFSSISMALSTPGSASEAPIVLPCGKLFTKQVSRDDKKSNFYAQMLAKANTSRPSLSKPGNSAN